MKSELTKVCESKGLRAECVGGVVRRREGESHDQREWRVTLRYQGRRFTVPFFQGMGHTDDPTAADVVSCLTSDARGGEESFETFCGDYGYDVDSRKAHAVWRQCARIAPRLRRLLGADFDVFANAEH